MKYDILLFDADNTVLDFDKSEEQALQIVFSEHNIGYDQNVLDVYRKNNIAQWQLYEKGQISCAEVLLNRFVYTFRQLGIDCRDIRAVAADYDKQIHYGFYKIEHAEEVLAALKNSCRLYVVSNGSLSIQNSRMRGSGLDKYFVKRFIAEEIGVPKPSAEFFRRCFAAIDNFEKSRALIIGDSLTSDIQGGINAGIDTCWFNVGSAENNTDITPTYEIDDLRKLYEIVS